MILKKIRLVLIVFVVFSFLAMSGCGGKDEEGGGLKGTVEELSGKNVVEKGEKLKQQIDKLSADEVEKIQKDLSRGTYDPGREDKEE